MNLSRLDYLYLLGITILVFTFNFGANTQIYHDLHDNLRRQEQTLPGVVLNPLGSFASMDASVARAESSGSNKDGSDGDGDGDEDSEGGGEEEEMPDDGDEDPSDVDESASDAGAEESPESLAAFEEEKKKAAEEARVKFLETALLEMKLEDIRKNMDKSLLPADTRFSFEVLHQPDQLTDTSDMDEEELEFAEKLQQQIEKWDAELQELDNVAQNDASKASEAEWRSRVRDQLMWEEKETKRLREVVRDSSSETITGTEVHEPDYYAVEPESDANDGPEPEASHASPSHASDHKSVVKSAPKRSVVVKGDVQQYADEVRRIEKEISFWAHASGKSVFVWGTKTYVNRDQETYARGFEPAGFQMERRKKEGPMPVKSLAADEHPVLICLALKNDDCFSSTGLSKVHRYQRINRVLGLRAVLWSKDSFCKTISQGTQGEAMFADYTFHCWLFPSEWSSAKEYAQQHPDASFIVKPLTMGGGKGITVVDGEKELSKIRLKTHIVQNYLGNPHLIQNRKWDIRTYVLVTSTVPMRAYVFERGIVRFASSAYDPHARKGGKRSQYLTNTSVNKKYVNQNVTEITWAFEDLRNYLTKSGQDYEALFKRAQTAISIVMLSAEQEWRRYYSSHSESTCPNCFQIMGVDLIVDDKMNPRVIEVNGQPSMKLSSDKSDHYSITKMRMMSDMVAMLFGTESSIADDLLVALKDIDREMLSELTKVEWEYLLDYYKERRSLGGWQKVYPNRENHDIHSAFLVQQKRNPTRLALHDILMHLEEVLSSSDEKAR
ncbi:Tubulin polyglutamylase TTLL6 [Hondaea fermentalgiana]|uniref:Tubulin polyglutamylase TTLL6 n=1 Tax=Hondaea fermentalgiana TaxID=2315210 RepID=A0A2R5G5K4_9STRA|nr:Tubulin polyglutamylase TTLL6 [Hondaea fermentalgiana]|eukprot:GBG26316.1 Tubulin polyglutamylase TTLL6 [Hondaea fermentalgiana]